jgi:phosphoribosylformylglycinamidine synthase
MVGVLEDIRKKMTLDYKEEGDLLYLVGMSRNDINSSEYLHKLHGVEFSPAPHFDLAEEVRLQKAVSKLIGASVISSAHDTAEGGLFVTLCESGFNRGLGFDVKMNSAIRKDAWLFGESQSRVVVSVSPGQEAAMLEVLSTQGVPCEKLGTVTGGAVRIDGESWGQINDWKERYDTAIEQFMAGESAESALTAV